MTKEEKIKIIIEERFTNNLSVNEIIDKYKFTRYLIYKTINDYKTDSYYKDLINVTDLVLPLDNDLPITNDKLTYNTLLINDINIKCDDITLNKIIRELVR